MVEVLSIDNEAVRKSQVDRIIETKKNRDEEKAQAALKALKKSGALETSTSDGNHPDNLLALAVTAAKARCTVGEISDALEYTWGRHVPSTNVVQGAYSAVYTGASSKSKGEYDKVLSAVAEFEEVRAGKKRFEADSWDDKIHLTRYLYAHYTPRHSRKGGDRESWSPRWGKTGMTGEPRLFPPGSLTLGTT